MKKTFFALAALAGLASADVVNYSTTNTDHTGTNAGNGYVGWCLRLDVAAQLTTTCAGESATIPASVTLDSVTYTTRPSAGSGSDVKVAIYEYEGDGETGAFVGLSSNSSGAYANDTPYTITFSGIELSTDKRYQFLFVDATATADIISTFDGYKTQAKGLSLSLVNPGTGTSQIPGGWGTYSTSNLNGWASQWMPALTIATHTGEPVVPEPATATLSLLALAGLAARRRRH